VAAVEEQTLLVDQPEPPAAEARTTMDRRADSVPAALVLAAQAVPHLVVLLTHTAAAIHTQLMRALEDGAARHRQRKAAAAAPSFHSHTPRGLKWNSSLS
jgi:hypothetical protein